MATITHKPNKRHLRYVQAPTTTGNTYNILVGGFKDVRVQASIVDGNGTWTLNASVRGETAPAGVVELVAAGASINHLVPEGYRWIQLIWTVGTSTGANLDVSGIRKN